MTLFLLAITLVSAIGLAGIAAHRLIETPDWRTSILILIVATTGAAYGLILYWSAASLPVAKGGSSSAKSDVATVVVLYVCMLLGMLAHYAFKRFEGPEDALPFQWTRFLAPLFASPIVFIPLLGALQNSDIDISRLDATRSMIFFVAFENGFFWRDYFDQRQRLARRRR